MALKDRLETLQTVRRELDRVGRYYEAAQANADTFEAEDLAGRIAEMLDDARSLVVSVIVAMGSDPDDGGAK